MPGPLTSRSRVLVGVMILTLAAAGASTAGAAPDPAAPSGPEDARVEVEYFTGPGGHPRHTTVPASPRLTAAERAEVSDDGDVHSIVDNGAPATKLDVVFLGDGYTAAQQGDFHADAAAKWNEMAAVQPYAGYRTLFNVWAVDAHSAQSGIDGDPTQGVRRDTALDSGFFCDGVERLLCVDTAKVEAYAAKAPDADLVVMLGNSAKYGGAGYFDIPSAVGYDGISTASSDHPDSDQVAVHETGHSLGKLADEYVYEEYGTYTGPEPPQPNSSTLTADLMAQRQTKWHRWLGQTSPDGGTVGTYEGGNYHPRGLYRPTQNSIMRTLGREFNLPGREAMIAGFYRHAAPLTSSTDTGTLVRRTTRLTVRPAAASVRVRWYVDGREARAARGETTVTPRRLGVPADRRAHAVTARATDRTPAVRDPELRELLTGELTWQVKR